MGVGAVLAAAAAGAMLAAPYAIDLFAFGGRPWNFDIILKNGVTKNSSQR